MGYRMLRYRDNDSSVSEFKRALMKAKEAIETICDLSEEMEEQFGWGERSRYSHRDNDDMMWERRRRY